MKKLFRLLTASLIVSICISSVTYASGTIGDAIGVAPTEQSTTDNNSTGTETQKPKICEKNKKAQYIDLAIASEMLGIPVEDLKEALKSKSLYTILDDAKKVNAFKKALIQNFSEKVNADHKSGHINKTQSEKLIQKFAQKVNAWNG